MVRVGRVLATWLFWSMKEVRALSSQTQPRATAAPQSSSMRFTSPNHTARPYMYVCSPAPCILRSIVQSLSGSWARSLQSRISFKQFRLAAPGRRISIAAMRDSPPPTPPSRAPNGDEWRFKTITLPCEWIEDYRPGGYHPVHLGDVFHDGQYKVIRKLGEGSYSTVWLARDLK